MTIPVTNVAGLPSDADSRERSRRLVTSGAMDLEDREML